MASEGEIGVAVHPGLIEGHDLLEIPRLEHALLGDRSAGGNGLESVVAAPTGVMVEQVDDPRSGRRVRILYSEPRQDVDDTIVQIQSALFGQLHGQRRGEGLRDGADRKGRVSGDGLSVAGVRDTDAGGIGVGSVDDADSEPRYMQLCDEIGSLRDDRIEGLLASQFLSKYRLCCVVLFQGFFPLNNCGSFGFRMARGRCGGVLRVSPAKHPHQYRSPCKVPKSHNCVYRI